MNPTSLSLLVRLRQSDAHEAWARFTQLYTPLLFYWARRVGLSSADADDFVQDVLMLLLGKIGTFEPRGPGSFRAWLRTVAVNKCRERLRRQPLATIAPGGSAADQIADEADDPFWETEYRQHVVAPALAIMQAEFEPATWQACWQRVVEDRPATEVAANLGLTPAAVYVYTGRVLRRLREELGELLE